MNENVKYLIDSALYGKKRDIEFAVEKLILSDKTKKDERFKEKILNEIEKRKGKIEVPSDCSSFLTVEMEPDVNLNRYLITAREKEVCDNILKYQKIIPKLSENGIKKANSCLLFGEPGTGKTQFGKYISHILGIPFLYVNLSFLLDSLLGGTQKNISKLFRFANTIDCVLMIDEIDAVCTKRGSSNDVSEIGRVTISIMQEIDKLSNSVFLLGATNRLDIIDSAVKNRFKTIHEVKRFDLNERKTYVTQYLSDVGVDYTDSDINQLCENDITQRTLEQMVIDYIVDAFLKDETGLVCENTSKIEPLPINP